MTAPTYVPCPGCGKPVQALPPRRKGRWPTGWRRKQHYLHNGNRCRYPATMTDPEIGQALIQRIEEHTL